MPWQHREHIRHSTCRFTWTQHEPHFCLSLTSSPGTSAEARPGQRTSKPWSSQKTKQRGWGKEKRKRKKRKKTTGCCVPLTLNSNSGIKLKKGRVGGVSHFQEVKSMPIVPSFCQYIPFPFLPLLVSAMHHFLYYFCTVVLSAGSTKYRLNHESADDTAWVFLP